MIDEKKRRKREIEKKRVRERVRVQIDKDNYEYIPEIKRPDFTDNDVCQRVAIYVRVSTDDVKQTTSYELQQKYYQEFVEKHPKWELVKIYADEGISGTSTAHRKQFNQMLADCKDGKIDLIITKSVSRFARDVLTCIGVVRKLSALHPPVGVFFESEAIFSLREDNQMTLSFLATIAEEESRIRSRSMEASLRMRLDNGIPLTPELLGYMHNERGELIVNPEEAPTVKLAFFMYLLGYSSQEIASALNRLGKKSYLGNVKWTANGVIQILRNERHCGDVLTRKTFTPDFHTHKSAKNRGDRPQSRYLDHHERIVSRDDFIAVQHMIDNAKYQNRDLMPKLRVIQEGLLKGFVLINPRWSGFHAKDYIAACESVETERQQGSLVDAAPSGFEVVSPSLFGTSDIPMLSLANEKLQLNMSSVRRFAPDYCIEFWVHPFRKQMAARIAPKDSRSSVCCAKERPAFRPRLIPATAYASALYELFGWRSDCSYKLAGSFYQEDKTVVCVFDVAHAGCYLKTQQIPNAQNDAVAAASSAGRVRVIPESELGHFGVPYSDHRSLSPEEWHLGAEGKIFETKLPLNITPVEEMQAFVQHELYGEENGNGKLD